MCKCFWGWGLKNQFFGKVNEDMGLRFYAVLIVLKWIMRDFFCYIFQTCEFSDIFFAVTIKMDFALVLEFLNAQFQLQASKVF